MNDIIPATTAAFTTDTTQPAAAVDLYDPAAYEAIRHDMADADMLVLPAGTTNGLTTGQIEHLRQAAIEAAAVVPRIAPPAWAGEDDGEGHHPGPLFEITPKLALHSSWEVNEGGVMWMDATLAPTPDLTPAQARELAGGLLQLADLIEGQPGAPTVTPEVPEPAGSGDALEEELEGYAACEALASRVPAPRAAPRMRAASAVLDATAAVTR